MQAARMPGALAALLTAFVAACDVAVVTEDAASSIAVEVQPPSASIGLGLSLQFQAQVTGTADTAVIWSADCGSVTQAGFYSAPAVDGTCRVVASSRADSTKSATATVTVTSQPSPPVSGWGVACASEPLRTTGTVHYFCDCVAGADADCVAGNDANAGTSPSAPRRTWSAAVARFSAMAAGDTVALCKGGRFNGNSSQVFGIENTRCTAGSTCDMRDYAPPWGSGDEGRPTIAFSGSGVNGLVLGNWASSVTVAGFRILNLAFVHASAGTTGSGAGLQFNDRVNDVEVCNCVVDGWSLGVYSEFRQGCANGGQGRRRRYLGNRILNSCSDGALVEEHDSVWDGNFFDNNGHDTCSGYSHIRADGPKTHTFYMASECTASNNRFINNEIRRNAFHNGGVTSSAVKSSPSSSDLLIENNLVDMTPSCFSVACGNTAANWLEGISLGSWNAQQQVRPVIRRNRIVTNNGRAIGLGAVRDALVEDNIVSVSGAADPGRDLEIIGTERGAFFSGTFRNNTVHVGATGPATTGFWIDTAAAGVNLTGNSITFAGTAGTCFAIGSNGDVAFMNNNHCSGGASWKSGTSLPAWRTATGFDADSITSAPLFTDPPAGDFTPQAGSPLVGAASRASTCTVLGTAGVPCSSPTAVGSPRWSSTDPAKARDASPDIGAVER